MRITLFLIVVVGLFSLSFHLNKPSFNGSAPGCSGSGCHTLQEGLTTASLLPNLQVEVTLHGVSQGSKVGGELVNANGTVVDVIETTTSNPFLLTAPGDGNYRVNAGYKPSGQVWDSTRVTVTTSSIREEPSTTPQEFQLYQNHPNPFNGQTVIRFYVAQAASMRLTIFNISGEKVRSLSHGHFNQGQHRFIWNGRDDAGNEVPSGVYIYQLAGAGQTLSHRMILSK